jgi:hypothetical protein
MHVCMYVCVYACMHVCMYACMHVCMYVCIMYVCMYVCMYEFMYACMHVCVVCMFASVHVCLMFLVSLARLQHECICLSVFGVCACVVRVCREYVNICIFAHSHSPSLPRCTSASSSKSILVFGTRLCVCVRESKADVLSIETRAMSTQHSVFAARRSNQKKKMPRKLQRARYPCHSCTGHSTAWQSPYTRLRASASSIPGPEP